MSHPTPPIVLLFHFLRRLILQMPIAIAHHYRLHRTGIRRWFPRLFVGGALLILAGTTLLWSYLGARLQAGNADQLVDPYLFQNAATLHGAVFPSAHTFLLKWPLFWLVELLGGSVNAYIAVTLGVCVLTVAALAAMVYWFERRPYVYGLLLLLLASMLLLVPPQSHPGALLPVNMAMLATRNIEYVVYGMVLLAVVRARRLFSPAMAGAALLLAVLVASDRLFLGFVIGTAVLAGAWALLRRSRFMGEVVVRLVVIIGVATLLSAATVFVLTHSGITHITSGATAGPYGLSIRPHQLMLGLWYAVLGVLSVVGANPAYDALTLRSTPVAVFTHLMQPMGLALIVNLLCIAFGMYKTVQYVAKQTVQKQALSPRLMFVGLLGASFVSALVLFIGTQHDYSVDARYLAVVLPALLALLAAGAAQFVWQRRTLIVVSGFLLVGIVAGISGSFQMYYQGLSAGSEWTVRNQRVAQALQYHPVSTLLGDYWRVVPIRSLANRPLTITPLGGCTTMQQYLTSSTWQPDLRHRSFAYLFTPERGPTGFPACSLDEVFKAYGRPNASTVIQGSLEHPREQLLFYDQGIAHPPTTSRPSTVFPIALDALSQPKCVHQTIVQVVAHEDDDLLFMSPDLLHSLAAGDCMRTVYLTAGDAGVGSLYWLGREQAAKAAYAEMLGQPSLTWTNRIIKLGEHQFVTMATPSGFLQVTLVFMHLPDGNLRGEGFRATNYQSIARLERGTSLNIAAVDQQSSYTTVQLEGALARLLAFFRPAVVRTHAPINFSTRFPDHSDHLATGWFAARAYETYRQQITDAATLTSYLGYPVRERVVTVTDKDLQRKNAAFYAYAAYDPNVCDSETHCQTVPTYRSYLQRQYSYE